MAERHTPGNDSTSAARRVDSAHIGPAINGLTTSDLAAIGTEIRSTSATHRRRTSCPTRRITMLTWRTGIGGWMGRLGTPGLGFDGVGFDGVGFDGVGFDGVGLARDHASASEREAGAGRRMGVVAEIPVVTTSLPTALVQLGRER